MEQPDLSKYRASLKEGDTVNVLAHEPTEDKSHDDDWRPATVISSSEAALSVTYEDGEQEVISWKSVRIRC